MAAPKNIVNLIVNTNISIAEGSKTVSVFTKKFQNYTKRTFSYIRYFAKKNKNMAKIFVALIKRTP